MTKLKSGAVLATMVLTLTGASCPPPVAPAPAPVVVPASCPAPTVMAEDGSCVSPDYWDAPTTPPPVTVPEPPACKVD